MTRLDPFSLRLETKSLAEAYQRPIPKIHGPCFGPGGTWGALHENDCQDSPAVPHDGNYRF
jgi:hypothetical protein